MSAKPMLNFLYVLKVEMSKWVSTCESTRLTTGSSRVGLRKIQFFQKWVELNLAHLYQYFFTIFYFFNNYLLLLNI